MHTAAEAVHRRAPAGRTQVVDRCAERSLDDSSVVEGSTAEGLVAGDGRGPGLAIVAAGSLQVGVGNVGSDRARDSEVHTAEVAAGDCIRRVQAVRGILAGHHLGDARLLC